VITGLEIENFKRFRRIAVELRGMSVLTGLNGTGKSSLIQSLLVARYASEYSDRDVVPLNGPFGLALGEAAELLNRTALTAEIGIALRAAGTDYRYRLEVPDERSLNLRVLDRPHLVPDMFAAHGRRFTYLNAERLGPRDQLEVMADDATWLGVGERGQYTAQVLAAEESTVVRAPLRHPSTEDHGVTTLLTQVEDWVRDILRPVRIEATWLVGVNASVIRFREHGWLGESIRPTNMGFGFSYALPIIVAGLQAPADGILIVENPEAHLHPAGQSRLGRFLGRVAGSGTQVIVETHSDHVLNGVRLAVAADRTLPNEEVLLHFFEGTDGRPTSVELSARGDLTAWPEGFFDQIEEDLGRLARARRTVR
jgi:predicted ATPase